MNEAKVQSRVGGVEQGVVSDIAVFVLKRDVKLQLTHSLEQGVVVF